MSEEQCDNDGCATILEPHAKTSPNRAGVADPHLKIWDTNLGQHLGRKRKKSRRTEREFEQAKGVPFRNSIST